MSQALKLVAAAALDPVALSDVKNYLRIEGTTDDTMLTGFISAATRMVEKFIDRRLINQTWDLFLDDFPRSFNFDSLREGTTEGKLSEYLSDKEFIEIPLFPLQSVTHLKTFDDSNTEFTMSNSLYYVDTISEPGRLSLTNNGTWPSTVLRPVNGVNIRFVCGYGANASDVPFELRQAIMEIVGKFYSERGCSESEDSIPKSALMLLTSYRVFRLG
jgi:hypothetical protein